MRLGFIFYLLFPSISYMDRVATTTTAVLSLFPNGFFTL